MSQPSTFFITTAIDYPNSRPHIGTAFEKIGADVQARFRRMEGVDTYFLMGNDENTIKVSKRAKELGVEPQPYVDDMASQFKDAWHALDISFDDFIQTSEERHHVGCRRFIQAVHDAGDIDKRPYKGLYCEGCEEFKSAKDAVSPDGRELKSIEEAEAAGACCPNHPNTPLRIVEEENYFFKLSSYADRLLAHYEAHPEFIQPESRRNEILNLVRSGLQDVSISRKGFTWGIKIPFDEEQTIYVWFDALLNYITALGYGSDDAKFRRYWPADVHVIGKDITRFHCALWPAMLMSAGLPLPNSVFAHGFVYRKDEGSGVLQKMSKSIGNVVEPIDLVRQFSSEGFRYYFMSQCPFGGDGEFSFERFAETYNTGLANNLGNLYSRTVTMCQRYFDGALEGSPDVDPNAWRAELDLPGLIEELRTFVGTFQYAAALQRIWLEVLDAANRYIEATQPFKLAKTDPDATRVVLVNLAEALRVVSILIKPFLPRTAETFYSAFNFADAQPWDRVSYRDASARPAGPDLRVTAPLVDGKVPPLFPKIDLKADAGKQG
ncbi:methionine--tRNA ligase [Tautonia plasticadhaerens]|uniref:Methionine--tRNA ligase n=1 Tax=Tautonia plasticadhaerens TaxID=2527974 RepID=A0A518GUW2_9BACT|nr:methionine--tRNA ligase [Tautonia plasticadhaerens]QDV32378.1 Methionine--tRNA ligase [Tautonia plasticadhaerens]